MRDFPGFRVSLKIILLARNDGFIELPPSLTLGMVLKVRKRCPVLQVGEVHLNTKQG